MEKNSNCDRLLWDYRDLIEYGGLSRRKAYEFLKSPEMPTVKIGSRRFMNAEKFKQWVDEHTQQTES